MCDHLKCWLDARASEAPIESKHRLRSIFSLNPTAHSAALINLELGGGLIRALGALLNNPTRWRDTVSVANIFLPQHGVIGLIGYCALKRFLQYYFQFKRLEAIP
jgi:hypothetical protein